MVLGVKTVGKQLSLEDLKFLVLHYAWDSEKGELDIDKVFDFLKKLGLLRSTGVINFDLFAEVEADNG